MNTNMKISSRIKDNGAVEYYLSATGATLTDITSVSLADQEAAVFTVFQKEGKLMFHCPIGKTPKLVLTSLHDAITKHGKVIYVVGSMGGMQ